MRPSLSRSRLYSCDTRRPLPQLYEHVRAELHGGGRVYIVCPLVEASSVAAFSEVKAVEVEYERLQVRLRPAAAARQGHENLLKRALKRSCVMTLRAAVG